MEIKISTTYYNVTPDFLENWLNGLNLPELHKVQDDIREYGCAEYKSKDPDSDCYGITSYLIVRDSNAKTSPLTPQELDEVADTAG